MCGSFSLIWLVLIGPFQRFTHFLQSFSVLFILSGTHVIWILDFLHWFSVVFFPLIFSIVFTFCSTFWENSSIPALSLIFIAKFNSVVWICQILSIHSPIHRCLDHFYIFAIMNATMSIWVQVFARMFSIFLCVHVGVDFLGFMVTMFTFWKTSQLFFKASIWFYIPTSNEWEFQFLYILTDICYYPFFKL